jgi:hypothetical protein
MCAVPFCLGKSCMYVQMSVVCRMHFLMHGTSVQGCQMAYFQTINPNIGKFWRVLQWKMLVYFTAI